MNKREFLKTMTTAAIAAPVAAVTAKLTSHSPQDNEKPAVVFDQVMANGVFHAGWFEEPPFTYYDPNTDERRGIAIKLAEQIAGSLSLKIEWTGISSFAGMAEDLNVGRFDSICASLLLLPRRGTIDYTMPYAYVPMHGYVRVDEKRFGPELMQLNDPRYTIAGFDDDGGTIIAHKKFPKAKFLDLPQNSQVSELLLNVAHRKADVAFVMPTVFAEFDRNNPGVLKPIASEEPLNIFAAAFGVRPGEEKLKSLLNNNIQRMIVSGELEDIFREFDPHHYILRPGIRYMAKGEA